MRSFKTMMIGLATVLLLIGCKAADSDNILPNGTYMDNFSGTHVFTSSQWNDSFGGTYTAVGADWDENYIIYQNSASNSYNPSKFSRVDFTQDENKDLYYCQIAYDKDTAAAAEAVTDADANDLAGGCSGFSWSKLRPVS